MKKHPPLHPRRGLHRLLCTALVVLSLITALVPAAKHFLSCGISELRQASSQFSLKTYSAANPDVTKAFSTPLDRISRYVAYVQYGKERRTCV